MRLTSLARSRSLPASLTARARIIVRGAERKDNRSIALRLQIGNATVGMWRIRFIEWRIAGLYADMRPGKPLSIDGERVAQLINSTWLTEPVDGATHWSVRSMAAETSISGHSVRRKLRLLRLQPHRTEDLKLSNDPFRVEELHDMVGLYLDPSDNVPVECNAYKGSVVAAVEVAMKLTQSERMELQQQTALRTMGGSATRSAGGIGRNPLTGLHRCHRCNKRAATHPRCFRIGMRITRTPGLSASCFSRDRD